MAEGKRSGFSGQLGFVLSAAGSAVGLGNLWRFPYLAARGGGGLFLAVYTVLVMTFGFALLATDIAVGRCTQCSALRAFGKIKPGWGFLGGMSLAATGLVLCTYIVIGGWILKFAAVYLTGGGAVAAREGYFETFRAVGWEPLGWMLLYLALTLGIVSLGVEKGVERFSRCVMPGLLALTAVIAGVALGMRHTDAQGVTRTGLEGLKYYLTPRLDGVTAGGFVRIVLDAMSQLFYSLSVSMGVMVTYGSYVKKEVNLGRAVGQIELFDTAVALLAGLMVVPAVYALGGAAGMAQGPGLMFGVLPQVFSAMGGLGGAVGAAFFILAALAALTSSVSMLEALTAGCTERFGMSRGRANALTAGLAALGGALVCLDRGALGGRLLDGVDWFATQLLLPVTSLLTCVLIGWVAGPQVVVEEMEAGGRTFSRRRLYAVMIRFVAPAVLVMLLLAALGAVFIE